MERRYRLTSEDRPIRDTGPVLEDDKVGLIEDIEDLLNSPKQEKDVDKKSMKIACNLYNELVDKVKCSLANKEKMTAFEFIKFFEIAKMFAVNQWGRGQHENLGLDDMLEIGKCEAKYYKDLKEEEYRLGMTLEGFDDEKYGLIRKTNFLIQRAIDFQEKERNEGK